jgi:hypothetical protein
MRRLRDERAKAVDFSIHYPKSGIKLLVRKDAGIKSLADLNGKKIVVGRGTTGEALVKREAPKAELVYTDAFQPPALMLVRSARPAAERRTLVSRHPDADREAAPAASPLHLARLTHVRRPPDRGPSS